MSRSFKKNCISKDNRYSSKLRKQLANRRYRRAAEPYTKSGKSHIYRRYTDSWEIHDYVYRWTRAEAIETWYKEEATCVIHGWDLNTYGWHRDYKTLKEFLNKGWKKCVYRK